MKRIIPILAVIMAMALFGCSKPIATDNAQSTSPSASLTEANRITGTDNADTGISAVSQESGEVDFVPIEDETASDAGNSADNASDDSDESVHGSNSQSGNNSQSSTSNGSEATTEPESYEMPRIPLG